MTKKKVAVVAVGGNSLIKDKAHQTIADQYNSAQESISHILYEDDIEKISKNARNWIEMKYNYKKSIESFIKIKKSLTKGT